MTTDGNTTRSRLDSIEDPRTLLVGLFENSPVAFQVYRADGHCLLVNQAFRELFQSEPSPEYNVFHDDIAAKTGQQGLVRRAFAGETITLPPFWYDPRELTTIDQRVRSPSSLVCFTFTNETSEQVGGGVEPWWLVELPGRRSWIAILTEWW